MFSSSSRLFFFLLTFLLYIYFFLYRFILQLEGLCWLPSKFPIFLWCKHWHVWFWSDICVINSLPVCFRAPSRWWSCWLPIFLMPVWETALLWMDLMVVLYSIVRRIVFDRHGITRRSMDNFRYLELSMDGVTDIGGFFHVSDTQERRG